MKPEWFLSQLKSYVRGTSSEFPWAIRRHQAPLLEFVLLEEAELRLLASMPRAIATAAQFKEKLGHRGQGLVPLADYLFKRWRRFYGSPNLNLSATGQIASLLRRDKERCAYCEALPGDSLEIHHVIPEALNGPSTEANLVTTCGRCNQALGMNLLLPCTWWKLHPESRYAPSGQACYSDGKMG